MTALKTWNELPEILGYYVDGLSHVQVGMSENPHPYFKKHYRTQSQAKAFGVIAAQLSQLLASANGEWKPDWNDSTVKITICRVGDVVKCCHTQSTYCFLAFENITIATAFLEKYADLIDKLPSATSR